MRTFTASIDIAAAASTVWHILTEVMPRDPTPFGITRLDGHIAENGHIKLWSEIDPKRAFTLKIDAFQPPHRMVWRGGMPFGLFTGTRTFDLSASATNTRFEMTEVFSGPLSRLTVGSIPDLSPSFKKFAQALKEKAEKHE